MTLQQREQIERLYLEMYEMLMAYARSSLNNEALAEEAVQETFRIACQKPEDLCSSENPQGWVVIVLKNTIKNIRHGQATAKRILEQYLGQMKNLSITEDRIDIRLLYENIADLEEFKLLSEMAIEGRSHKEMADSRGITVAACKKRVQRAKEILQRKIKI